jgi:hypothetical protein
LAIMSVPANQTKHEKNWMKMKAIWILITMAHTKRIYQYQVQTENSTLTCDIQCQSLLPTNLQTCLRYSPRGISHVVGVSMDCLLQN